MPDADRARLVVGTAALGLEYGLPTEAGGGRSLPSESVACAVVEAALAAGVSTFDTAPAYGVAEARLGAALGGRGSVWTKIGAAAATPAEIEESLECSRARLGRRVLDVVQWHNWTPELGAGRRWRAALDVLRRDPDVRAVGATTYGPEHATAAVCSGAFDVVQVEWSVLNPEVVRALGRAARDRGVRIAVRSVLLQGVLAGRPLPPHLGELGAIRDDLDEHARRLGLSLPALAIRAALDHSGIDHVLIGLDHPEQLAPALEAAEAPMLDAAARDAIARADRSGAACVDPRRWPTLEAAPR